MTESAHKPGRVRCEVPFCARTFKPDQGHTPASMECICGKHWRLGDERLRRLHAKARRRGRWWLASIIWRKVLRQATERSAGITG